MLLQNVGVICSQNGKTSMFWLFCHEGMRAFTIYTIYNVFIEKNHIDLHIIFILCFKKWWVLRTHTYWVLYLSVSKFILPKKKHGDHSEILHIAYYFRCFTIRPFWNLTYDYITNIHNLHGKYSFVTHFCYRAEKCYLRGSWGG